MGVAGKSASLRNGNRELHDRKVDGRVYIDDARKQKMEGYLEQYGVKEKE